MNTKRRDGVFQRWSGEIAREARDLASLEQTRKRAMVDSDVREDLTLQSMIQAEVRKRRAELEEKPKSGQTSAAARKSGAESASVAPEPTPEEPPEVIREEFNRLVRSLCTSLEQGNETETRAVFKKMHALHTESPDVIPAAVIGQYEQRLGELRIHIKQLTDEIAILTEQALSATRDGNEQDLVHAMRRLTAIHAAHPRLLDEPGLEEIRRGVAHAAEERRQHQLTTKTLLERERAITAAIKAIAGVVRDFHQVACMAPDTSEEFRKAEAAYLRAIQTVRTYDTEWFTGVVLELADLLAEWTVPPLDAGGKIERFLDSIEAGLGSIRAEMRQIRREQESDEGNESKSAAP